MRLAYAASVAASATTDPAMFLDAIGDGWQAFWAIPHIRAALAAGWAAYLLWLGTWIVLQKREPVATLSWLLGLAALPYIGFLVYLVFGPQKLKRHRLRRSRNRVDLPRAQEQDLGAGAEELARLGQATSHLPPSTATDVRLLQDGGATYEALLADIARAHDHVHLEYYIYAPDRTGTMLRDALVERARAGVKVRLLLDAIGSSKATRLFF
jgi:cardiolipin synthase